MRDPSRRLWEHLLLWDRSLGDEGLGFIPGSKSLLVTEQTYLV